LGGLTSRRSGIPLPRATGSLILLSLQIHDGPAQPGIPARNRLPGHPWPSTLFILAQAELTLMRIDGKRQIAFQMLSRSKITNASFFKNTIIRPNPMRLEVSRMKTRREKQTAMDGRIAWLRHGCRIRAGFSGVAV